MGSRRMSQGRLQKLINKNTNRLSPQEEFQVKKVMLHPDQDADFGATVTVSTTFTTADSGRIVMINADATANLTMTLPTAPAHGNHFTFLLVANSDSASQVLIDAGGKTIRGISTGVGNATYVNINSATVGFADAELRGAIIEIVYTGNKWFLLRAVSTIALITSIS